MLNTIGVSIVTISKILSISETTGDEGSGDLIMLEKVVLTSNLKDFHNFIKTYWIDFTLCCRPTHKKLENNRLDEIVDNCSHVKKYTHHMKIYEHYDAPDKEIEFVMLHMLHSTHQLC